jgi:arylsulfatase A-like enzyme
LLWRTGCANGSTPGKESTDACKDDRTPRYGQNSIRQSAVRKGDWKYLRAYKPSGGGQFSDTYSAALYNLKDDIGEERNLAPVNPEKLQELSALLEQWETEMSKTAIPFKAYNPKEKTK